MKHARRLVLAVVPAFLPAVLPVAAAQDMEMPKPSPELAKFEPLLGRWTGKGTFRTEPGAEAQPWTASMEFTKVVGGFAYQEDLVIDVGEATPLRMRSVYGRDGESGRQIAYSASNQGDAVLMDWHFTSADTLLVYGAYRAKDGVSVGRTVVKFTKDSYSFRHDGMRGVGEHFTEVEGSFTRGGSAAKVTDASFMQIPISAEMTALAKTFGSYEVTGEMRMSGDMPAMPIRGTETIGALLAGHVAMSSVVGESGDAGAGGGTPSYLSHGYMTWNSSTGCYDTVVFDTMGFAMQMHCRWTKPGEQLVYGSSALQMGSVTSGNTTVDVGPKGITKVRAWALTGASEPYVTFEAKYTPKK